MNNKFIGWKISAIMIYSFVFCASAQTPTDALLMQKGEFCLGGNFTVEQWDEYWEGKLLRNNGNIGTFSRQSIMPMLAVGITSKVTAITALPWVETKASGGQVQGAKGFQDWGVWIKGAIANQAFGKNTLQLQAVVGATGPASSYLSDYAPFNLGLGCVEGSLRGIALLERKGGYALSQIGYHVRGNSTIERNYYYTTRGYYTDKVEIPDAITYSFALGAWVLNHTFRTEVNYGGLHTLGGHDIRRQDVGFPSNKMVFHRIGCALQYQVPKYQQVGITTAGHYVWNGRNVGQSSSFSLGILYRFNLLNKQEIN